MLYCLNILLFIKYTLNKLKIDFSFSFKQIVDMSYFYQTIYLISVKMYINLNLLYTNKKKKKNVHFCIVMCFYIYLI